MSEQVVIESVAVMVVWGVTGMMQTIGSVAVMVAFIGIIIYVAIRLGGKQAVEGDEDDHRRESMRGIRTELVR